LERTTIAEAAKLLNITQEAIRARIKRGTIEHEKGEDGKTYVYLTDTEAHAQHGPNGVPNGMLNGVVNDYIDALKSEIESLKEDREEWKEEARRKDTIIAQMNQSLSVMISRVPQLEAPPEAAESSVRASGGEEKGAVPPDAQNRSWWRKIFTT
jgi:hypothetical protein